MTDRADRPHDPHALPVVRGRIRPLEPRVNPESPRDMLRWRSRIERGEQPLCVSLWSGAGGLDRGLEQAGYDVAVAADHDAWACQSHGFNSDAYVFCRDLDDPEATRAWLRGLELPQVALLVGGFPCQPYSRAGHSIIRHLVAAQRRAAVDRRMFAWQSFVAAVGELQPARALAENVPDLVRFDDGRQLRDIVRGLENLDYEVDCRILPARFYGVPQYRERLFIQAAREPGTIAWPLPVQAADASLKAAIADLPAIEAGAQEDPIPYEPDAAPAWARDGMPRGARGYLFDHICRDVRKDDLEAFRQLSPGGTYLDVPEKLRRYDDENFTDKYKRLEWERPSRTITAHIARDGYWYIHPEQNRTLSVREAARVQTFPDWFRFAGFPSNRYVQIGNAVPPLLGRAIGEAMLACHTRKVTRSRLPAAAAVLRDTAAEYWQLLGPWEILVREVIFSGRASDDRIAEFIERYPDPESAARVRSGGTDHERRAGKLGRAMLKREGWVPDDAAGLARLAGAPAGTARQVVALVHGGEPPRSAATIRIAERVSGVRRTGSLNGVSLVSLARLADFGEDVSVNQLLVDLGRYVCLAEDPRCSECPLSSLCAYAASRDDDASPAAEPAAL
jgi:DNA (cytosine-5)-methyltransferase 1